MFRLFDCFASIACLVILAIPTAIICLLIVLRDGRPVFYSQTRIGKDSKPFRLYKFRTMKPGFDHDFMLKAGDGPRISSFGRWLRRYHLDELPQLYNILRGDMSVIGPRPEVPQYYDHTFERISHVRPGLLDSATLFWLDEERILKEVEDPDIFYRTVILPDKLARSRGDIEAKSLAYDVRLLVRGLNVVFLGSSQDRVRPPERVGYRRSSLSSK